VTFPSSITNTLADSLATISGLTMLDVPGGPRAAVFKRPLRPSDPAVCIGIFTLDWEPDEKELGFSTPTLSTYHWAVQGFVKHGDEQEGEQAHADLSKSIRSMLYASQSLRVALTALTETSGGVTERVQRTGCRTQRYANNEVDGKFVFLSTTDFWAQTETVG
jgi:hypothetical protein